MKVCLLSLTSNRVRAVAYLISNKSTDRRRLTGITPRSNWSFQHVKPLSKNPYSLFKVRSICTVKERRIQSTRVTVNNRYTSRRSMRDTMPTKEATICSENHA